MAVKGRNKVSPEFNMSSMTDIVFLLLVFFIIASTMISPNGVDVLLPRAVQEPQKRIKYPYLLQRMLSIMLVNAKLSLNN